MLQFFRTLLSHYDFWKNLKNYLLCFLDAVIEIADIGIWMLSNAKCFDTEAVYRIIIQFCGGGLCIESVQPWINRCGERYNFGRKGVGLDVGHK